MVPAQLPLELPAAAPHDVTAPADHRCSLRQRPDIGMPPSPVRRCFRLSGGYPERRYGHRPGTLLPLEGMAGMNSAGLIWPVIDRVHAGLRAACWDRVREVYERRPGFERDFYLGLLARPMPAESFAAATIYRGVDGSAEIEQGVAVIDSEGNVR
jgi:hypothetical protein